MWRPELGKKRTGASRIPPQTWRWRRAHFHWTGLGAALIAAGAWLSMGPDNAQANRSEPAPALAAMNASFPSLPPRVSAPGAEESPVSSLWRTVTVKSGDNLSAIFNRLDLSAQQMFALLALGGDTAVLKQLYPGETIKARIQDDQLKELVYEIDPVKSLHVRESTTGLRAALIERPVETRSARATGVIDSSLFLAAQKAGLSDALTMELAGIFGWDIDFILDIREGDSFGVLHEELYVEGEKLRDGRILAAEFVNQGKVYRAVGYTDETGRIEYYTPEGRSLRKAFLRTPVEFSRISSGFSLARRHPVLNRIRAHKGVDYAAATGTPVKATGDGKVILAGVKGGYGKAIELQHGSRYSTLYGHLSRYASGLRAGARVRQGQVIGYVGQTGLATGPHLHYEFRVDGVHRNPLAVKFPDAEPIPAQRRARFLDQARPLLAQLDLMRRPATTVALNQLR